MARDYSDLTREELIETLQKLEEIKYGLIWNVEATKEQFEKEAQNAVPVLEGIKEKQLISDLFGPVHIMIEGDNYHALQILSYTHKEKVDIIYIDPPYNRGEGDFMYNDNYVDKDDPWKHSKWLSFMNKRLRLAQDLLKESGIIFISIDDNESAQLRLLCDGIFGSNNHLATLYIKVRYEGKTLVEDAGIQKVIETVYVYGKTQSAKLNQQKTPYVLDKFHWKIIETDKPTRTKLGGKTVEIFRPGQYEVRKVKPSLEGLKEIWASGKVLDGNSSGRYFRDYLMERKTVDGCGVLYKVHDLGDDILGYRYFTGPKQEHASRGKYYQGVPKAVVANEEMSEKNVPIVNYYEFSDAFGNCRNEGGIDFRYGKKPVAFLKTLLELGIAAGNIECTILDFFAGSGSTCHAVIDLNTQNKTKHQCILCTNNESGIATEVCYPRLMNIILGSESKYEARKNVRGLGGNLRYFKTNFIPDNSSEASLKMRVAENATQIICLQEGIHREVYSTDYYKVFNEGDKTVIIYHSIESASLPEVEKHFKNIEGEKIFYIFTLGTEPEIDVAECQERGIRVEPFPQKIIQVWEDTRKLSNGNGRKK